MINKNIDPELHQSYIELCNVFSFRALNTSAALEELRIVHQRLQAMEDAMTPKIIHFDGEKPTII